MLGYHRRFCPRWSTLNIFWVFLLQTSSNFSKLGYNLSIGDIESVVGSGSKLGSSMAVSNETNVLFIPYRPSYSSKPFSANDPGISQQKHAAREYHRKVKLKRLANKTTTTHKRKPYTEIDINSDQSRWSIRSISPRDNTFPNGEERDASHRISDVGSGQWDLFHVCVPQGVPDYVLEMLDHGKSRKSSLTLHLVLSWQIALQSTFNFPPTDLQQSNLIPMANLLLVEDTGVSGEHQKCNSEMCHVITSLFLQHCVRGCNP